MKPVIYHEQKTFVFETQGNEKYGEFDSFIVPRGTEIQKLYENFDNEPYGYYTREVEFRVKNHVWKILESHGAGLETTTEQLYTNKLADFSKQELNFLNAYQNRFIYIQMPENRFMIIDGNTNDYFYTKELETFKEFRNEVKKHFLV